MKKAWVTRWNTPATYAPVPTPRLVKGFKTIVPAETPRMPVGKWVKFRLEARGRKLTLDVDGERAWEFSEFDAERGYVGIQVENKSFDFRNLRIQEIPGDAKSKEK